MSLSTRFPHEVLEGCRVVTVPSVGTVRKEEFAFPKLHVIKLWTLTTFPCFARNVLEGFTGFTVRSVGTVRNAFYCP